MSSPTLHDFVLNLLTDPAARTAFEIDPQGVLVDAGLGDITEADVQEVIPLVMDYAPVADLPGLAGLPVVDDAAGGIDGDVTGAVRQLQDLTQFAVVGHGSGSDYTVTAATAAGVSATVGGGLPFAPAGLPVLGAGGGLGNGLDLSLLADPGDTLDSVDPAAGALDPVLHAADPVLHTADPVLGTADPLLHATDPVLGVADPVLGAADPVLHTADPVLGTVTGLAPVSGTVDSLGLGGLTGIGTDPHAVTQTATDTVQHTVSGVTGSTPAGHDAGADHGGLLDHLLH
jgi:hypothetical protein